MGKAWEKPELVILVRYQPQEAVLQSCKYDDVQFAAPNDVFANCNQSPLTPTEGVGQQQCILCSVLVST